MSLQFLNKVDFNSETPVVREPTGIIKKQICHSEPWRQGEGGE